MNNQLLTIKVKCKENDQCLFEEEDMHLEILIINNQNVEIGFPLEFSQHKGPSIKLFDTLTKKHFSLSTHLADWALQDKFTFIKPGEALTMRWVILKGELRRFGHPYVDVTAEIKVGEKLKIEEKLVDFLDTDTIHIVSKDMPSV